MPSTLYYVNKFIFIIVLKLHSCMLRVNMNINILSNGTKSYFGVFSSVDLALTCNDIILCENILGNSIS